MDTTLRLKAMEKESLTSKFLFDRCYLFVVGLFNKCWFPFNAWSVFAAYPWLLLKFHDTFEDVFGKGWGIRGRITIGQVSSKVFFPALSFMETDLNFLYVNQIERYRTNLTFPLT